MINIINHTNYFHNGLIILIIITTFVNTVNSYSIANYSDTKLIPLTSNKARNRSKYGTFCDASLNLSCDVQLNQLCVNNHCKCEPNHRYNDSNCEHFLCDRDIDCQNYDTSRKCVKQTGLCVCKSGHSENLANGRKCALKSRSNLRKLVINQFNGIKHLLSRNKKASHTFNKYCSSSDNCDTLVSNQICVSNRCKCAINYVYDGVKCARFACTGHSDCHRFDRNRICNLFNGNCICSAGFTENVTNNGRCECNDNSACDDSNQVCNYGQCVCKPSHKRRFKSGDDRNGYCDRFRCSAYYECAYNDELMRNSNRHCFNGSCVCDTSYREHELTAICNFVSASAAHNESGVPSQPSTQWSLILIVIVSAIIIGMFVITVFVCILLRKMSFSMSSQII